jgi:fatty acid desaturase
MIKVVAWVVGFVILFGLFISAAESENYGLVTVVLIVALVVLGPAYIRWRQRGHEVGLGSRPRNDAMQK